jgi:predicted ABC-type ATPase
MVVKRFLKSLIMSQELYVIAGPNGIGKTTSSFDLVPMGIPIINSDGIAAAVRDAGSIKTNAQEYSNHEALRLMNEYLQKRESFAIETNLADRDTWKFLIETQKYGYKINMIYLSTDNLALLNARTNVYWAGNIMYDLIFSKSDMSTV